VVKTVRDDEENRDSNWREVLLEIRALLHEPLRYHPNVVRLLDIRWNASVDTGTAFPALVLDFAEFGTLDQLQRDNRALPFSVKQKLCYDVGRGLSIIHACGMVHGDLKHENVLIFPNAYDTLPNQPFTAKLADFGGTLLDMGLEGAAHRVPMFSFPYEAPEIMNSLTEEGAKKTDAFSYGMLIWRCMVDMVDYGDILVALGLEPIRGRPSPEMLGKMNSLKVSDALLVAAIHNTAGYFFHRKLPDASSKLATSALMFTLRGDPAHRALDRAQVHLRGMDSLAAYEYAAANQVANKIMTDNQEHRTPGKHGVSMDSVGYALGRLGHEYDAQNNLPGFRPDLPRPETGGFLFEPLTLRRLLDWGQQEAMVREFRWYADAPAVEGSAAVVEPWSAAFFLYQSYLCGFGVPFSAEQACYWLRKAANPTKETSTTDYYAQAWLNRVHAALRVPNPYSLDEQIQMLSISTVRGHRHCKDDGATVILSCADESKKRGYQESMDVADRVWRQATSATGMAFFLPRLLKREWNLDDFSVLDDQIKAELGNEYESCLRPPPRTDDFRSGAAEGAPLAHESPQQGGDRFDKIFVNGRGHGLLHMAASQGRLAALRHLHRKYRCDINLKNQSHEDTPLTCACRCGQLACALYCLDNGADANGGEFVEEAPLHCISGFLSEEEMETVVGRLMAAGGDMEKHTSASRKDVRNLLADWEDSMSITLTPLGRAVLRQSQPAVRVLLRHGADPVGQKVHRNRANLSPVELAAILTLPDMLEELHLMRHISDAAVARNQTDAINTPPPPPPPPIFDECGMLEAARSGSITPYDSLSLQSRLVRCGTRYKECLHRTLKILRDRGQAHAVLDAASASSKAPRNPAGRHLCAEISLGNTDIVDALLDLGHPIEGSAAYRPIRAAVAANNKDMFLRLLKRGSPLSFEEDDNTRSLLHVLADRPSCTPRDLSIAEHLVHGDLAPVDPVVEGQPSPLALAIRLGHYELADLLISRGAGASLSVRHPPSRGHGESISLLGYLLRHQTSAAHRAIKYLADHHNSGRISVSHVAAAAAGVDNVSRVSVVHALAMVPHGDWNSHGGISAGIAQSVLEMFPGPESLANAAVHPRWGTPLTMAVEKAHPELVTALLASRYRSDLDRAVKVRVQLGGSTFGAAGVMGEAGGGSGLAEAEAEMAAAAEINATTLAQLRTLDMLGILEGRERLTRDAVEELRRRVEIASALTELKAAIVEERDKNGNDEAGASNDDEERGNKDPERKVTNVPEVSRRRELEAEAWRLLDLGSRIAALEGRASSDESDGNVGAPKIDRDARFEEPVDLSVLTDERPSGWHDGIEMTQEMALRNFLKSYRTSETFGNTIMHQMSKFYNKRQDDDESGGGERGEG